MGIAWLLLLRTIATRPRRTALFLLGYGLSTAVMITLLSVGEAVLKQAQNKDLLGGGDFILVPQSTDIESLKVGGLSALYYSIPQARFIVGQLLNSSRFRPDIQTVSPYIVNKLLYARPISYPAASPETVFATGSLPDQEKSLKNISFPWQNSQADQEWLGKKDPQFYHAIDHFHVPSPETSHLENWAEWHYFNFEASGFSGYLSFMVAGDVWNGRGTWMISLQIMDDQYKKYSFTTSALPDDLPLKKVDYRVGGSSIRFTENRYEIQLDLPGTERVTGMIFYKPEPDLYFPPTLLAQSKGFESGYVIPALRGSYQGTLKIGSRNYQFDQSTGYHDHNWGIWQKIEWNWGHLYSDKYAMFFGEIFLDGKNKGLFTVVFDRSGFLTLFRPEQIQFSDFRKNENGIMTPHSLEMKQSKMHSSFQLHGTSVSQVATPLERNDSIYFIQSRMTYFVTLTIDGSTETFTANGNSETFVGAHGVRPLID